MSKLDEAVGRLDVASAPTCWQLAQVNGRSVTIPVASVLPDDLRTVLDALEKHRHVAEAAKGIREELDEIVSGGWEELDAALADLEVLK